MERSEQLKVIEALVLASPEPLTAARIGRVVPECNAALVRELIKELNEKYVKNEHAFEIWEVGGGYQVRTRAEFSGYLQKLQKQRPLRLSSASLETLAIVAYKQPATRAEIEYVRGVDAGAVLKGLLDRGLVKLAGHKDVPGRPMLYATTRRFLEIFGLDSLKNLPALRELEDLAREQGIEAPDSAGATPVSELVEGEEAATETADSDEGAEAGEAVAVGAAAEEAPEGTPEPIDIGGELVREVSVPIEDFGEVDDDAAEQETGEPEIMVGGVAIDAGMGTEADDTAAEVADDEDEEAEEEPRRRIEIPQDFESEGAVVVDDEGESAVVDDDDAAERA
ncbi:MAG: SMC-Scp complex subunit ScpB [Myxococcota bacterium]|jgi:segregation and condensation protein B|nr:SMC-Scp complex subunit ScpB [Myxococcota bacterium]